MKITYQILSDTWVSLETRGRLHVPILALGPFTSIPAPKCITLILLTSAEDVSTRQPSRACLKASQKRLRTWDPSRNLPTPNPKGLTSPLPLSLYCPLGNLHHFHQVSHLISSNCSQASFLPALRALQAVAGRGAGRRLFAAAAGVAWLVTGAHGRQGRAEAAGGGASVGCTMAGASRAPKGLPWFASLMVGKGQQWGFLGWLFLREIWWPPELRWGHASPGCAGSGMCLLSWPWYKPVIIKYMG